jgi:hypothetical protein
MSIIDRSIPTTAESDKDRVADEADMIAEAEVSLLAGLAVSHQRFRTWSKDLLENLDRPHAPPI